MVDGGVVETSGKGLAEFSGICLRDSSSKSLKVVLSGEDNMWKTGASACASGLVQATEVPETLQAYMHS